ncbi:MULTISPECIES: hypothetical protein [unclassified Bacillus (in: firmicutes)]|uniref:hypothetical protein n=1 Tax=unclassified Bacillus (in: firmicutes) TaxID=185979 RepID=UPI001BEAC729|nr:MULTISPECIES: hypothetical protein [unclassified Bacillus (in: firmicutes)]MBT2640335.1 hypothetical protein [Bacillus sp. ISL-39]MBT2662745.1 hypothetical protein [Bacillus sp. ISL-45]
MISHSQKPIHPTIRKCMQHLDVIQADDKTKQIVYMYMETLLRESNMAAACEQAPIESQIHN